MITSGISIRFRIRFFYKRIGLVFNHPALAGQFMKIIHSVFQYIILYVIWARLTQSSLSVPRTTNKSEMAGAAGPLQLWKVAALRWRASKSLLHHVLCFHPHNQ